MENDFGFFLALCVADMVHFSVRRLWKMKKYTEHWTVSYIDNDIHASDVVGGIDADNDDEADDEDDDDDNDDETDDDDETEDDVDDEIEVDVDDETDDVDDVTFAIVMLHQRKFLTDTFKQHLNIKHLNVINVIIWLLRSLLWKFMSNHNMKVWSVKWNIKLRLV